MSIGVVATGPLHRLAGPASRSPRRHLFALLLVTASVTVLEWSVTDFDHGTHLLVLLTLVMGIALLLGPRPAATGFATGGIIAGLASLVMVDGAYASPHAYVQLLTYLAAGSAFIVLVSLLRSRQAAARLPEPAPTPAAARTVAPAGRDLVEPLTVRETEVLRLAATGIPVDEIAARLFLSPNTVKTHLTHAYAKLGVRGRSEAVRAALHNGCLSPEDICPHLHGDGHDESPVRVMPEAPERMTTGSSRTRTM